MTENTCVVLEERGVVAVSGVDARSFLQGIITCDVHKISPQMAVYGAFLTPQGKYLVDFFIAELGDMLVLDMERAGIADFIKRLSLYKLRSDVSMSDVSDQFQVMAFFGGDYSEEPGTCLPMGGGVVFTDPRLSDAGQRAFIKIEDQTEFTLSPQEAYDNHRLSLGLPDGSRDLIADKSTLMENGFDELNGIDWHKGCYMGQEVTARMKHRGLVKKRLVCVDIDGPPPALGTPVMIGDREAGEMRSSSGNKGLALIKLDFLGTSSETDNTLIAGKATIRPRKPDWATF
jgi:hypothetical protein